MVRSALATVICFGIVSTASAAPKPTDGVLNHLIGSWKIEGTTLGKPTITGAEVRAEFGGSFLELHVKDPANRDPYEAQVFFGTDNKGRLVIHWLDGTGGETSRTLGSGQVKGDLATMRFSYPDGVFRNRLTYDEGHDRWRLFIEMGPMDHPKVFSDWVFTRR